MKPIIPHLWFDKEAKEAAELYARVFPNSKVTYASVIHDTPGGDTDFVSFEIDGQPFMAISAGPIFKINPSISFLINFDPSKDDHAREHLDEIWAELSKDGKIMMPLQEYPFSKWYGWTQDRYGVSWQLMLTNPEGEPRPYITPCLLFTDAVAGKAQEASDFYLSIFEDSERGTTMRYPEGTVMFTDFRLGATWLAAMDSPQKNGFMFNEAVSLMVQCDTQEEIDEYWSKLSADPKSEQCGWLKDKYGVSWQIAPTVMQEMLRNGTPEQVGRVTKAFLTMKKFNIATLKKAYEGAG